MSYNVQKDYTSALHMQNNNAIIQLSNFHILQRSLLLGCLVYQYRFSLPNIGHREIGTAYRIIILLSLIYCDSNIELLSIFPYKVIALNLFCVIFFLLFLIVRSIDDLQTIVLFALKD